MPYNSQSKQLVIAPVRATSQCNPATQSKKLKRECVRCAVSWLDGASSVTHCSRKRAKGSPGEEAFAIEAWITEFMRLATQKTHLDAAQAEHRVPLAAPMSDLTRWTSDASL